MKDWVTRPKPRPACRLRLFCFPYAGVGPSAYRGWPDGIEADVEVCLVHLPGREGRLGEPSLNSIAAIAAALAAEIRPFLACPYVFFGHSFGATIAFETARHLRNTGCRLPELLIASASRAPHLPWPYQPVAHLGDFDLLREIHRRYDSVPAEIMASADLRELLAPALRADITALETYTHSVSAPFPFGIRVFGGRSDVTIPEMSLESWREHTSGTFARKWFDGGHLYLQTARQDVIRAVSTELNALSIFEGSPGVLPMHLKAAVTPATNPFTNSFTNKEA